MKNKKLFAILTLVCFMFTLMPVAAFAADYNDHYVVAVEKNDVAISATDDSISVKAGDSVSVGVTTATSLAGVTTESVLTGFYFWVEDNDGNVEDLTVTTESAYAEFDFDTQGTYYVYAVAESEVNVAAMEAAFYTDEKIVEFIKDKDSYVEDYLTVKVKKNSTVYTLTTGSGLAYDAVNAEYYIGVTADNGWSSSDVTVQLQKGAEAVKGEELKFSTNSSYVTVEVDDNYTDRRGEVEFTVSASKAGSYKVYVTADGAEKLTIPVVVNASNVASVETVAQPQTNVALGTRFFFDPQSEYGPAAYQGFVSVAFEFTSTDDTIIKSGLTKWTSTTPGDYKITIVDQPADSTLDADDLTLRWDGNTNNAWVLYDANDVAAFDEEGKYVIKVSLENGDSATATVNVVEFDEATRMILIMKANTVSYGETVEVKAVSYMDAKGTMMVATHPDYSSYGEVEFAANGKAVASVVTTTGAITAKGIAADGDELVGTTITAFAINEELELTATATITVVDKAAELKYQSTTADIAVNNKLIVNPVDENGNVISNLNKRTSTPSVYVLSAPANAAYSAEVEVTDTDEMVVTLTASAAGEYKLQTVVRTADGAYLSSVDTIVVGGTTSEFKDVVVMSIGSANVVVNSGVKEIPAAPMIQDGRTFVPFRALAEAFGADVEWVEDTQSVVAELNGVKVVMVIGENAYTVDGVAKTADVAPFINGASTMVPVRFVAEAFGINVTPLYAADGSVADVLFAK